MSGKQQLAEALETIPESATLEEAFTRLYKAFKERQRRRIAQPSRERPFGMDVGKGKIADDFDMPLPEDVERLFLGE